MLMSIDFLAGSKKAASKRYASRIGSCGRISSDRVLETEKRCYRKIISPKYSGVKGEPQQVVRLWEMEAETRQVGVMDSSTELT